MAVGMLQTAEMFTKEMYGQITEKMFGHSSPMRPEESPEGLIVHSAGQGEGGWYVYDIWAAQEVLGDQQLPPEAAPHCLPDRGARHPELSSELPRDAQHGVSATEEMGVDLGQRARSPERDSRCAAVTLTRLAPDVP